MSGQIDNSYFDDLGANIRARRKELKLKQEKLADMAWCSRQTIVDIELGNVIPKFETVINIAKALDCSIDYLTGHIDKSTHKLQGVCDYTGLSEEAVKNLHHTYSLLTKQQETKRGVSNSLSSVFLPRAEATINGINMFLEQGIDKALVDNIFSLVYNYKSTKDSPQFTYVQKYNIYSEDGEVIDCSFGKSVVNGYDGFISVDSPSGFSFEYDLNANYSTMMKDQLFAMVERIELSKSHL